MNERSIRGLQEGDAASKTRESPSVTVDDRLAATIRGIPPPVQSPPRLRIAGPIRRARGFFAYFTPVERAPSLLPDAFYLRNGFAYKGKLPSHETVVSLRSRQATSDTR